MGHLGRRFHPLAMATLNLELICVIRVMKQSGPSTEGSGRHSYGSDHALQA